MVALLINIVFVKVSLGGCAFTGELLSSSLFMVFITCITSLFCKTSYDDSGLRYPKLTEELTLLFNLCAEYSDSTLLLSIRLCDFAASRGSYFILRLKISLASA